MSISSCGISVTNGLMAAFSQVSATLAIQAGLERGLVAVNLINPDAVSENVRVATSLAIQTILSIIAPSPIALEDTSDCSKFSYTVGLAIGAHQWLGTFLSLGPLVFFKYTIALAGTAYAAKIALIKATAMRCAGNLNFQKEEEAVKFIKCVRSILRNEESANTYRNPWGDSWGQEGLIDNVEEAYQFIKSVGFEVAISVAKATMMSKNRDVCRQTFLLFRAMIEQGRGVDEARETAEIALQNSDETVVFHGEELLRSIKWILRERERH